MVVPIMEEKIEECQVKHFPIPDKRLNKDGSVKKTPNNNTETRWVYPIVEKSDVKKVCAYLESETLKASGKRSVFAAQRNLLLFKIGINVGLRVSDLLELKWEHFFEPDMKTFISASNKHEKKTGKGKLIIPNEYTKKAIESYLSETGIEPKENEYVFISSNGKHITDAVVEKMIKKATRECGLPGNYSTHSLRKTYAYHKYNMYVQNGDSLALVKVQKDLNHRNSSDTARYLGITRNDQIESSIALGDYWE